VSGDFQRAIGVLEALSQLHPGDDGVTMALHAARELGQRRLGEQGRLEAEQRARRERERTILKVRQEAADLMHKGSFGEAISVLERLDRQFPGVAKIQRERAAAVEQEILRREAEERAKQALAQFTAKRQHEADEAPSHEHEGAANATAEKQKCSEPEERA
jgi:hypothetical protein